MPTIICEKLEYREDSCRYVEALRTLGLEKVVFIDSSHLPQLNINTAITQHKNSRYDIISAQPLDWLSINSDASPQQHLTQIEQWFERYNYPQNTESATLQQLPFTGGIIASFNYELGHSLNKLPPIKEGHDHLALFCAGFYPWAIVQDHLEKTAYWLLIEAYQTQRILKIKQDVQTNIAAGLQNTNRVASFHITQAIEPQTDQNDYARCFAQIQNYIGSGDCYQVNFSRYYTGSYRGDPWQAYQVLRQIAQAPFSIYWDCGTQQILCVSPERFLNIQGNCIRTQPIKGTRARSTDPQIDAALAYALSRSSKDCAENLMIVDLLRNDLGKNCTAGSIHVDSLFKVESFNTVHHLVSAISGTLKPNTSQLKAFWDCFPGGSITGAPKIRAMQIIAELEQHQRQLYCGSIAYFSHHGRMDSNICIRTFICKNDRIYTWAGGAIVADSDCAQEYAECNYKIGSLIDGLQKNS